MTVQSSNQDPTSRLYRAGISKLYKQPILELHRQIESFIELKPIWITESFHIVIF